MGRSAGRSVRCYERPLERLCEAEVFNEAHNGTCAKTCRRTGWDDSRIPEVILVLISVEPIVYFTEVMMDTLESWVPFSEETPLDNSVMNQFDAGEACSGRLGFDFVLATRNTMSPKAWRRPRSGCIATQRRVHPYLNSTRRDVAFRTGGIRIRSLSNLMRVRS